MFFQSRLSKCLVNPHLHFFLGGGGHATYNDGLQKDEAGSHSRKIWSEIYDRLMKRCYPIEGSVQLSSRWDLCAQKSPYGLHPDFQKFPLCYLWNGSNLCLTDSGPLLSFRGRSPSASSFHTFLLQAIDGVMSLALCPQVVSQASQHFRSSEKQATCEGCFACQCICLAISPHSSMSRAVHPQDFSKVDVNHWLILKCQVLKSTHGLSPASLITSQIPVFMSM